MTAVWLHRAEALLWMLAPDVTIGAPPRERDPIARAARVYLKASGWRPGRVPLG